MRYILLIEYSGTNLHGWQRQNTTHRTIQEIIEQALFKFIGKNIIIYGSGRTDSGVHARCQIAHFNTDLIIPIKNIIHAINHHVKPNNIVILSAMIADENFHARFSATERIYNYYMIKRAVPLTIDKEYMWQVRSSIDIELMQEACKYFVGRHDFTSFRAGECQAKSPVITVNMCKLEQNNNNLIFTIAARSFLHHMVRNIVGTIYEIGLRKKNITDIEKIFVAKDRKTAGITAPSCGLYLTKIVYNNYPEINKWILNNI